jgi:hypothetical protein
MIAASNVLLGIAIVSALCGVATAVMIAVDLQRRGVRINWFLFRVLLVTRYLGQYRDLTQRESGRPGLLFYSYIAAMNLALFTAVAGIVLRVR